MRIGYLITAFPLPSETFVYREVLGLRRLGLDIDVYAVRPPTLDEQRGMSTRALALMRDTHYLSRAETARGLLASPTSPAAWRLNRRFDREATRPASSSARLARAHALARLVRRRGTHRLHAHWPYGSQLGALAHELTGLPLSISVHAHEVAHEAGHFPALFERVDFAAFCNAAALQFCVERLGEPVARRAHLVYHGVDLDDFEAAPAGPPPPPLRLVSAGRLTRTKGFARLVRGLAAAREAGLDVRATLVGDGPERASIEGLASSLGVRDALEITGWVPHEAVRGHLAAAHAFVLLADTTFHDGLPNVVLEAMAVGRPALLSPLPAAPEVVVTGETGAILSSPEAYGELVDLFAELVRHPERAVAWGQEARARVRRDFDATRQLRGLCRLFAGSTGG